MHIKLLWKEKFLFSKWEKSRTHNGDRIPHFPILKVYVIFCYKGACPSGWTGNTRVSGVCYKILTTRQPHYQQENICRGENGHLASIHSENEINAIKCKYIHCCFGPRWMLGRFKSHSSLNKCMKYLTSCPNPWFNLCLRLELLNLLSWYGVKADWTPSVFTFILTKTKTNNDWQEVRNSIF